MKIGIDIRLIGKKRTGDEVVFFNIVKNLAKIDNENEYVLLTDIVNEKVIEEIKERLGISDKKNFEIVSLESANKFVWNFFTLPQYSKKNPVDIYHTQYITPWFVSRKIKIVTVIHDISFNFFPQFIKPADLFFLKMLIPISIKRANKVLGVSQFTRDEIIKFYNVKPDKVDYFYNAVGEEMNFSEIESNRKEQLQKKYNLPQDFILYIGTLQPRKNIPFLIEAFAKISEKLPDYKLVIGGNRNAHNFDKQIDEAIRKHKLENKVIFAGFIDEEDKKAVYKLAKTFAFPSLYEGFGIPLLEAMSQEVPVVASDIPSLQEVGENAVLFFNHKSLDDFSNKLYTICIDESLRGKLIQEGISRVSFFSWEKTAEKILAVYKELLIKNKKQ